MAITAAMREEVSQLYVALFGRAPDGEGLGYWVQRRDAGLSVAQVANEMYATTPARTYYPSFATNAEIVTNFYVNVLGRQPDAGGLAYWTGQLNSATPGSVIASMINNVMNYGGTDAQGLVSAALFQNKAAVATAYGLANGSVAGATSILSTVTDAAATRTAALTSISSGTATGVGGSAGQTFTLTTGFDNSIGGNGRDNFYGTVSASSTLNPFDILEGGSGTDTLHVTLNGASYAGDSTIRNVEVINVRVSTANDFNANGLTGLTELNSTGSIAASIFSNVGSASTAIGMNNIADGNADLAVRFSDAALTGTNDTVTVNLNGAGDANNSPDLLIRTTAAANGAENLSVVASGNASVIALLESTTNAGTGAANSVLKTLRVSGDKNLTVSTAIEFAGNTGTVDASTFTGNLKLGLDTGGNVKVTGGSGNDEFTMSTGLTVDDTIDGGSGTDTVSVTNMDSFTLANYKLSNIEIIDQQSTTNVNLTLTTGGTTLSKVVLRENATTAKNLTVSDLAAGVAVDLVQTTDGQVAGIATLGLKDASGTADALTVTLKGVAAHGAGDNAVNDLAVLNVETLNLISSSTSTTGGVLAAADANTISDISSDTTLGTINASGSSALIVTVGAEATNLKTFNGADMTADLSVTLATGDVSVTGGSKDDTFIFGTSLNNKDTVVGGSTSTSTTEDLLTATVTDLTATTGALVISQVERINLTNGGTAVINATKVTGATEIGLEDGGTTTTITGLATGTAIGLGSKGVDQGGNVGFGTVDVALADSTGTADSLTFNLNDIRDTDVNTVTLKTSGIETVTLAYSTTAAALASHTVTSTNLKAATIAITGSTIDTDNTVDLGTLSTSTTSVNASSFKGVLKATAASGVATSFNTDGAQADSMVGSTGSDTVTISGSAAVSHTIDGGAGNDTLNMTLANGTSSVVDGTNIETAVFTVSASAAAVLDLDGSDVFSDTDLDVVTITGGNSLSTFAFDTGDKIGNTAIATINASTFAGKTTLAFASAVFDSTTTITGGASTGDTITADYASAISTVAPVTSGIEVVALTVNSNDTDAAEAYSINTGNMAGVTRIELNTGSVATLANDQATTLTGLAAGVAVRIGNATADYENTSSITLTRASASGTSDSLSVDLYDTEGTITLTSAGIETLNLSTNILKNDEHTVNLSGVAATTGSTQTINITGGVTTKALTISDVSSTTRVINAVDYIGNVVLSDRGSSAMTITGGLGGDTLRMENAADVIDGGTDTGDTLQIVQNAVLGGFQVDLSSTTDQVTTYNGSANSAAQIGFFNVNLAGVTGTFGADVTAHSSGSTITGTTNNDVFTGAAGVDTYNYTVSGTGTGAGSDTFNSFSTSDVLAITAAAATTFQDNAGGAVNLTSTAVAAANYFQTDDKTIASGTGYTAGTSKVIIEVAASVGTLGALTEAGFRAAFGKGAAAALVFGQNNDFSGLVIAYDGTGTAANAAVFYVNTATESGTAEAVINSADTVQLVGVFNSIGANAMVVGNFS